MIRFCAVIPTYDNPGTLRKVVLGLREHLSSIFVVDDGSGTEAEAIARALSDEGLITLLRLPVNQGKGAACMAGFAMAKAAGFSHAVQVDADDQHNLEDVPRFVAASEANPDALICGVPIFGNDAPMIRVVARRISVFWVAVEISRGIVLDPLCGFRVYPLEASLRVPCRAPRMGFDTDIAVRLVFAGTPTVNLGTCVRYPAKREGAVSHFRPVLDSIRLSALHTRLFFASLGWRIRRLFKA